MDEKQQVQERIAKSIAQLGREMGGLPDCAFEVSVNAGVVEVLPKAASPITRGKMGAKNELPEDGSL